MPKSTLSSLSDHLVVLRDHYQELLTEQESKALHLREQLTHISGLLSDLPVLTPEINASPDLALKAELTPEPVAKSVAKPSRTSSKSKGRKPSAQPKSSGKPTKSSSRKGSAIILPLLPRFVGMSKIEAVGQILQDNAGQVLHMDQIITALVGELNEADLKAERSRIKDTLYKGAIQERWVKLKDQKQSYTLDKKLLKTSSDSKPKGSSKKTTKSRPTSSKRKSASKTEQQKWQPEHQGKSLTTAISDIMQAYQGEVMTTEGIAEELYGEKNLRNGVDLTAVKKQIATVLGRAVTLGHWQRVEDQRGAYILG
ncbi:MAG: hypothetical protein HC768_19155 [Acaryochloris sp. CRU_2_0]|nr:hypothetical protein [Acaryochloris sp. CRU_2_0]